MTVSTTLDRQYFDANGVNVNFPFNFKFLDNADIYVWLIAPDGTATPQFLTTNYTLTGALNDAGGQVTMIVAPPLTVPATRVLVQRVVSQVQPTSIRNQGKFFAEVHENVFDRLTMLIQQALSGVANSMQLNAAGTAWDFRGKKGANAANPTAAQDVATLSWVQSYIGGLISTGGGPANLAANVLYVDPYGVPKVVQDMSGDQGGKLNGYKAPGTNTVKRDIYEKVRREIELGDYVSGGADNTVQFQNMLADIPNKTVSRMISIPGLTASYSGTTPRVITRAGDYSISATLNPPAYLRMEGEMAFITMNNAALDIFSALAYQWEIDGFVLIGGRHQIDYFNDNINSTMIDLRHIDFFLSSGFAVNTRATGGVYTHLSTEASIYKSRIMNCRQAINNACDSMTLKNSWVQPSKTNMAASTAVFVNKGASALDPDCFTRLKIQDTFLIPDLGVEGVDRVNSVRWVDNYGSFLADHARFGGENGGIPIVWHHQAPNTAFPLNTTEVILRNSALFCGPDARIDSCVLGIVGQVPNTFIVEGCPGPVGRPLIANLSSTDLTAYFAAFEAASGKKAYEYFKVQVDVDTNDINAYVPLRPIMPNGMYPYLVKGRSTKVRKQTQSITNAFAANLVSFSTVIADNLGAFAIANPTRLVMPGGCSKMIINASVVMDVNAAAKVISVDVVDSGGTFVDGVTMNYGINPDSDRIKLVVEVSGVPGSYWSLRIRHLAAAALNMIDCQVKITPTDLIV